jgi:quercetin dioxygenase-like cupin family protein
MIGSRLVAPGEGTRFDMIDGAHVLKAGVEETGSGFEVFEVAATRAPAVPPHTAPWHGVLYVLAGELRVEVDGDMHDLVPGATVTLPAGIPNTFTVTSDTARFLAVTAGTGASRFFADFARSVQADRPVRDLMPDIQSVTRRHGVSIVPTA